MNKTPEVKRNVFCEADLVQLEKLVDGFFNFRILKDIFLDSKYDFLNESLRELNRIWLTEYQTGLWKEYCERILVPRLSLDFENKRLQTAYALCFADARNLAAEVRARLGLTPHFEPSGVVIHPPGLYGFGRHSWAVQCNDSEGFLAQSYQNLLGMIDPAARYNFVPCEFLGCLVGKSMQYISGVCFETTEFANGAVMIEDVWYFLRGPLELIEEIERVSYAGGRENLGRLTWSSRASYENGLVVLPDCAGVWQPTRLFNPGNIGHEELGYSRPV